MTNPALRGVYCAFSGKRENILASVFTENKEVRSGKQNWDGVSTETLMPTAQDGENLRRSLNRSIYSF